MQKKDFSVTELIAIYGVIFVVLLNAVIMIRPETIEWLSFTSNTIAITDSLVCIMVLAAIAEAIVLGVIYTMVWLSMFAIGIYYLWKDTKKAKS